MRISFILNSNYDLMCMPACKNASIDFNKTLGGGSQIII